MTKKKKKQDTMSDVAIGGTLGVNLVGMTASVGGGVGASGMSANFAAGVGNVGRQLPKAGKVKATTMVIKPLSKLHKKYKKLERRML